MMSSSLDVLLKLSAETDYIWFQHIVHWMWWTLYPRTLIFNLIYEGLVIAKTELPLFTTWRIKINTAELRIPIPGTCTLFRGPEGRADAAVPGNQEQEYSVR